MSDKLHSTSSFNTREGAPVLTEQEAGWATEQVRMFWTGDKDLSPLQRIKAQLLRHSGQSAISILTMQFWLPFYNLLHCTSSIPSSVVGNKSNLT
jgi:hypothetical protein